MLRLSIFVSVIVLLGGCSPVEDDSEGKTSRSSEKLNLVFSCSPDNDLYQVVTACNREYPRYGSASEAIEHAAKGAAVLILADGYPEKTTPLDKSVFTTASEKNLRLYVEYPSMLPDMKLGERGYQKAGHYGAVIERTVAASDMFEPALKKMRIMMVNDCYYLPVEVDNPHLVLTQVEGYDTAVYGITEAAHPLLFEHPAGNVMVSTTKLSQFVTGRYSPTEVWGPVWQSILGWLVPDKTIPQLSWTPTVRPMYQPGDVLPKDALAEAVRRGAGYYNKSRLLIHPDWPPQKGQDGISPDWPVGDGSLGIGECYISKRIFIDGTQAVSRSSRTDCNLEAAMGLACGLALQSDASYEKLAHTLNDLIFFKSIICQGKRADPESPSYGLLSYHTGDSAGTYWGDDNARSLLGAIGSAALLNSDRWDESIIRGILANFRTTGIYGFRPANISDQALQANGWQHYFNLKHIDYCPHMEAFIWTTYFWLYDKTGFEPLLERPRTGVRMMMKAYPNWRLEANRYEQERCRMLLPLAWLVRADDTPEHRKWLDTIAQYIIELQDESGAIGQVPGHVVGSNAGYGTGECSIVHETGDPATDALYSINFAFIGMHEAAAATGNRAYAESAKKMADFFIRSQTQSQTHPELDSTWYRGFDYKKWDYWASDGDWGWGVWTNEIGWTHSWITATLAFQKMNTSLWDISAKSEISRHFDKYRKQMIPDEALQRPKVERVEHKAVDKPITLVNKYYEGYNAGGNGALVDSKLATKECNFGLWQGYEGADLDAVIDIGEVVNIGSLNSRYLQHVLNGIFMPRQVEYAVSQNGTDYEVAATAANNVDDKTPGPVIKEFIAELSDTKARYIRVRAKNIGTIPDWHNARGAKAWLFADEIIVK